MIKTMQLENFKAFEDTGELEFRPLTVLAGPNSGGKTSILQSLLLLKQTLEGAQGLDLNLDGQYLHYSEFNELTFDRPSLSKCEVVFTFETETPIPRKIVPRYFPEVALPDNGEFATLDSKIQLRYRYRSRRQEKSVVLDRFHLSNSLLGFGGPELSIRLSKEKYRVTSLGKGIRRLPNPLRSKDIDDVHFMGFVPLHMTFKSESGSTFRRPQSFDQVFMIPTLGLQFEIEDNLKYLGPLRERPRRAYLHSGNPSTEIGESGQYAAQILWLERDNIVEYLPELGRETKKIPLIEAVNNAFLQVGMVQPLDIESQKSIVYQILFRLNDTEDSRAVTIADVGFGVSQLLPILVLGLRSDKSAILMLEQPEIHLHPKLQANLADFLLTLIEQGKRVIVETHSDHFINRLRRRIAEDPNDELGDKVRILFVNPPDDGQGASITPLRVDRHGVIENWPPDFLPEASDEAEAIFLAGLEKRER